MGMALGKVTVETPHHTVVHTTETYQIWRYAPTLAATVHTNALDLAPTPTERDFTSAAFRALARYIGVFGAAENRPANVATSHTPHAPAAESVPVTAVNPEPIAMTAPVTMLPDARDGPATAGMQMSFFLPAKYTALSQAPVPTNPAVTIVELPEQYHAVVSYSGNLNRATSQRMAEELMLHLEKDGLPVVGDWSYCGYDPPFTLPWFKRNEVHVPVDGSRFDAVTENVE